MLLFLSLPPLLLLLSVWRTELCKMCEYEKNILRWKATARRQQQHTKTEKYNHKESPDRSKWRQGVSERERQSASNATLYNTHTHILTCRETERAHTYLKRQRKQHIRKTENRKLVWTALHTHAHTPQFTTAVVGSTSAVYTSTTYTYIFSWKCSYRAHYMHTFSRHVSNLCEPVFTWAAVEWMAKMW